MLLNKNILLLPFLLLFGLQSMGQIRPTDLKLLEQKEDSLAIHAKNMVLDSFTAGRMRSDSLLIRTLVRTLQVKNSFYFPFEKVLGISKLYAPDSSFRIFSWTLAFDEYYSRQRGAIQFKTADGSLRLIPLLDVSEETGDALDSIRSNDRWIGAVYYDMVKTEYRGKPYYTLFGIDNFGVMSNIKWIEVLSFNAKGQPQFGGPLFSFREDSLKRPDQNRIRLEYKEEARILLRYDPEMQMIVFDHLVPEDGEPDKPWTFVPDGDYEGFKWENGKWLHIEKIFHFKLQDGEAPVEKPMFPPSGNNQSGGGN